MMRTLKIISFFLLLNFNIESKSDLNKKTRDIIETIGHLTALVMEINSYMISQQAKNLQNCSDYNSDQLIQQVDDENLKNIISKYKDDKEKLQHIACFISLHKLEKSDNMSTIATWLHCVLVLIRLYCDNSN